MIEQYVICINNIKNGTVSLGKSSKFEEDVIIYSHEYAEHVVIQECGSRHLDITYIQDNIELIKSSPTFPSGLYILKTKNGAKIYEKIIKDHVRNCNIKKSIVWDYKFNKKPVISCLMDDNTFPTSNFYGYGVQKLINDTYKIHIKDTFKGTFYDYDNIKVMYETGNCTDFFMKNPNDYNKYNNNDIIYYINHNDESFIVELVKCTVHISETIQEPIFNLITDITYNKISLDTSNVKRKVVNNVSTVKTDHGSVFSQLTDMFKNLDTGDFNNNFKPSMLKKKKPITPKLSSVTNNITSLNVPLDIINQTYFINKHKLNGAALLNDTLNGIISCSDEITNLTLSQIISLYEFYDKHLYKYKNVTSSQIDDNKKKDDIILNIYYNNKDIFKNFLNTINMDVPDVIEKQQVHYWANIFRHCSKNIDYINLTINDVICLYNSYTYKFDLYFMENNIFIPGNLRELYEWDEIDDFLKSNLINNFIMALKYVL